MTSTDDKIKSAYDRLTHGRAEIADGQLTITNICLEAGVSRASFYRSAHAPDIRHALSDPNDVSRPEPEQLRQQVQQLNKTEKALRSQHASETRELRDTLKTYANQIQALALHVNQLEDENQRLQRRLQNAGDNITALADPALNRRQTPGQVRPTTRTRSMRSLSTNVGPSDSHDAVVSVALTTPRHVRSPESPARSRVRRIEPHLQSGRRRGTAETRLSHRVDRYESALMPTPTARTASTRGDSTSCAGTNVGETPNRRTT